MKKKHSPCGTDFFLLDLICGNLWGAYWMVCLVATWSRT